MSRLLSLRALSPQVHYFTNEAHERDQYAQAIQDYQKAEYQSMAR